MVTLADSLLSSSARPLPIRKRPDLLAQRQRYEGEVYWVVKDPVGLNYFRFQEEEFFILNQLDGRSSLDEIKARGAGKNWVTRNIDKIDLYPVPPDQLGIRAP